MQVNRPSPPASVAWVRHQEGTRPETSPFLPIDLKGILRGLTTGTEVGLEDQELIELGYESLDHLSALVPAGWSKVTIRRGPIGERLVVQQIAAKPGAFPQVAVPKALGMNPLKRTAWLCGALDKIQELLRYQALIWDGLTVEVVRLEESQESPIELRLVTPACALICKVVLESPLTELVVTPNLMAVVDREIAGWKGRQAAFEKENPDRRAWRFDPTQNVVHIQDRNESITRFTADIIGSHSERQNSWLWSWANESYEPSQCVSVIKARDDAELTDEFSLFRFTGFPCEARFAQVVSWLAASRSGEVAVFEAAVPQMRLTLFFALHRKLLGSDFD